MILEKRPDTLEAIKFEGGTESVQEVIEWVRARDPHITVSWTPEVVGDEGEVVIKEALYFVVTERSRHHGTGGRLNRQFRLHVNQWLVLDKANRTCYPTNGYDLFKAYKEVPDVVGYTRSG